jgi:Mn2+/Fe2+ NRAMP family transporter
MIVAAAMNFLGVIPMKALVFAGIVQGFSTPPLMLLIVRMTSSRRIMGDKKNTFVANFFGWSTTVIVFGASIALLYTWIA